VLRGMLNAVHLIPGYADL